MKTLLVLLAWLPAAAAAITLPASDATELFGLKATGDVGAAPAGALAGGSSTADFDSPTDRLVISANLLDTMLGDAPEILGSLVITHAMDDDTFIDIAFTPAGVGWLNEFRGAKVILAGLAGSVVPPALLLLGLAALGAWRRHR